MNHTLQADRICGLRTMNQFGQFYHIIEPFSGGLPPTRQDPYIKRLFSVRVRVPWQDNLAHIAAFDHLKEV
jgi:hypothetical protein